MGTWWQLRKIVPTIMVVAAIVNFALCLRSLNWLSFRTWEAAIGTVRTYGAGPFEPDSEIRVEHAYGDLASLGNIKDIRQYRPEVFRVDHFGFRNSSAPHLDSAGIVIGDSFATGAALSDSDTFAVQLSKESGEFFYNAGGEKACLANAEAAVSILKLDSGVAVFELLERNALRSPPQISELRADCFPARVQRRREWWIPAVPGSEALELAISDHSPAVILSRKMIKRLENGVWVPNPYSTEVVRRKLRNGDEMLFFPDDFAAGRNASDQLTTEWTDYFVEFSARMAERNIRTIVLLTPNKATVYAPLADTGSRDFHGGELLNGIESQLRLARIPVVNMTAVFQEAAKRGLDSRDYIYWRDDTHWNARGAKLAAECVWTEILKQNLRRQDAHIAEVRNRAEAAGASALR